MEKKLFINPTAQLIKLETSAMICGSGGDTATLPGGSGDVPTAINGVIGNDAKIGNGFQWK